MAGIKWFVIFMLIAIPVSAQDYVVEILTEERTVTIPGVGEVVRPVGYMWSSYDTDDLKKVKAEDGCVKRVVNKSQFDALEADLNRNSKTDFTPYLTVGVECGEETKEQALTKRVAALETWRVSP